MAFQFASGPIAFNVSLTLEGDLDGAARETLLGVARRCPVHQTLSKGSELRLELKPSDPD